MLSRRHDKVTNLLTSNNNVFILYVPHKQATDINLDIISELIFVACDTNFTLKRYFYGNWYHVSLSRLIFRILVYDLYYL